MTVRWVLVAAFSLVELEGVLFKILIINFTENHFVPEAVPSANIYSLNIITIPISHLRNFTFEVH